jgi:hypothetical protein
VRYFSTTALSSRPGAAVAAAVAADSAIVKGFDGIERESVCVCVERAVGK